MEDEEISIHTEQIDPELDQEATAVEEIATPVETVEEMEQETSKETESTGDLQKPESPQEEEKAEIATEEVEKTPSPVKEKEDPPPKELAKYWKVVKDNTSDFTGWTYLLQYVEQENHLKSAREAFDGFFNRYPYCYGYWKKYADFEKRSGNLSKACEVFERGTRATALSIDLWINYINFYSDNFGHAPDAKEKIRSLFEKAIAAAGTEFRSDKLWDMYITWEKEQKSLKNVTALYDRLLAIPTQLYSHHFDQFKEHINSNLPKDVLTIDEFLQIRSEIVASNESVEPDSTIDDAPPGVEAPPGEEEPTSSTNKSDPENIAIREKVIEVRKEVFRQTEEEVSKRWAFEEGVKRPYFHVKPLERAQLKNWREYLDFEIENGSHERVVVLFERCMIATALYEDFWLKYAKYLEPHSKEGVSAVFRRACEIHLPKKPNIHLQWAAYEEQQGNIDEVRRILKNLSGALPDLAMVTLRRISVERRQNNNDAVHDLLTECIKSAKNKAVSSFYSIKQARYHAKIQNDVEKAKEVLNKAIEKDKSNGKLYLQLLDLEFQGATPNEDAVVSIFDRVLNSKDTSQDTKVVFSQRKLEFLEDFGSDITKILNTYEEHQKLYKQHNNKKRSHGEGDESSHKKAKSNGSTMDSTNTSSSYNYSAPGWSGYNSSSAYNYQQPSWNTYGQGYYPS
ncbi:pre-mRNA-processing factor 39-like [Ptychodera flava]|uniref:pre-mRNA-processing factor 39-like n=1 Tax=Ptychodera flava TaxID=63121 RepID=UPI00396A5B03